RRPRRDQPRAPPRELPPKVALSRLVNSLKASLPGAYGRSSPTFAATTTGPTGRGRVLLRGVGRGCPDLGFCGTTSSSRTGPRDHALRSGPFHHRPEGRRT